MDRTGSGQIVAYDELLHRLLNLQVMRPFPMPSTEDRKLALAVAKRWAAKHIDKIGKFLEMLTDECSELHRWLEWSVANAWLWHSSRLGGLFDLEFVPYLSRILELDQQELAELHRASCSASEMNQVIGRRTNDYNLMSKAYITSAIIRGRYHKAIVKGPDQQLLQHPFRNAVLSDIDKRMVCLNPTNTMLELSEIIIDGARRQRSYKNRLFCWANNLHRARCALNQDPSLLSHKSSNIQARKTAYYIAKQCGLEMSDRGFASFTELAASLGVGILAAVNLSPWVAIPAATGTGMLLRKTNALHRGLNRAELLVHNLQHLRGGNISGRWS
ncbi:MAG: hypothetical protein ACYS30_20520 [Planctomycetota bacterium]